jgi:hypothetical protein
MSRRKSALCKIGPLCCSKVTPGIKVASRIKVTSKTASQDKAHFRHTSDAGRRFEDDFSRLSWLLLGLIAREARRRFQYHATESESAGNMFTIRMGRPNAYSAATAKSSKWLSWMSAAQISVGAKILKVSSPTAPTLIP